MSRKSAGILLYRTRKKALEVFLVHPGGPFWAKKDVGAWSIPKGEFSDNEDPLEAAKREFREETGHSVSGEFIPLSPSKQKSGKWVYAWALLQDLDARNIRSNTFEMEWPPRTGKKIRVPEVDEAAWFTIEVALEKINEGQAVFLDELVSILTSNPHWAP